MDKPQIQTRKDGRVFLLLPNETRAREIGRISNGGKTFECERNPGKHLYRNLNAYGFNYFFLENGRFDTVILHEVPSGRRLYARRQDILRRGKFLYHKQQGFEKQIFFRVSNFLQNSFDRDLISENAVAYTYDQEKIESESDSKKTGQLLRQKELTTE